MKVRHVLGLLVAHKLVLAGLVAVLLIGSEPASVPARPEAASLRTLPHWFARLMPRDESCYLLLLERGYEPGSPLCAFYPLWPWCIDITASLLQANAAVVALLLCNACSLAGLLLFYRLVREQSDEQTALKSLALLLCFPGAMFFCVPYSESLFFLLLMLFFTSLQRGRLPQAAALGFLLSLTRAIGVLCFLPMAWQLWESRRRWTTWGWCFGPICGFAAYLGVMHVAAGSALAGFEAQQAYPARASAARLWDLPGFAQAAFAPLEFHSMLNSALDRFFFLALLLALPGMLRLPGTFAAYGVLAGLVPALSCHFVSYSRYALMVFPAFIAIAQARVLTERPLWFWYSLSALAGLQFCFLQRHLNCGWAG
jgi:hypothetical protein